MRKYLLIAMLFIISLFFASPQPNYKYDVNYVKANRIYNDLVEVNKSSSTNVDDYIYNELIQYPYEIEFNDNNTLTVSNNKIDIKPTIMVFIDYSVNNQTLNSTNNFVAISSVVNALQTYDFSASKNNLKVVFANNNINSTLNGDIEYLNEHEELLENVQYVIIFNSRGNSGNTYLYNNSKQNSDIIDFFYNSVTSKMGFSDFTSGDIIDSLDNVQFISLGTTTNLNDSQFSQDTMLSENNNRSIVTYVNTVHEILSSINDDNILSKNDSTLYFNFLDSFVQLNEETALVMFVTAILLLIFGIYIFKKYIKFVNVVKLLIIFTITILFLSALSVLPVNSLVNTLYETATENFEISTTLFLFTIFVILTITTAIIVITILLSDYIIKKFDVNYIEVTITLIIGLLICTFILYQLYNTISVIFILSTLLLTLNLCALNLNYNHYKIVYIIYFVVLIPIIVPVIYFLICTLAYNRLILYFVSSTIYLLILFIPLRNYYLVERLVNK